MIEVNALYRRRKWNRTRPIQRVIALAKGVFWKPCPRCGVPFGGHEWRNGHSLPKADSPGTLTGICPPCAYEIGEPFEPVCQSEGHQFCEVWKPERTVSQRLERQVEQTGSFDLAMPPSEVYCVRCFMEFDPLTREPIGRPF